MMQQLSLRTYNCKNKTGQQSLRQDVIIIDYKIRELPFLNRRPNGGASNNIILFVFWPNQLPLHNNCTSVSENLDYRIFLTLRGSLVPATVSDAALGGEYDR